MERLPPTSRMPEPLSQSRSCRSRLHALTSHRGSFLPSGLPNVFDIDMPSRRGDAVAAVCAATPEQQSELHLYDCTTGECFSYDFGFPAAGATGWSCASRTAGRWVAAVNAAPFPAASRRLRARRNRHHRCTPVRRASAGARGTSARWQRAFNAVQPPAGAGGTIASRALRLLDAALERGEIEHPWARSPRLQAARPSGGDRHGDLSAIENSGETRRGLVPRRSSAERRPRLARCSARDATIRARLERPRRDLERCQSIPRGRRPRLLVRAIRGRSPHRRANVAMASGAGPRNESSTSMNRTWPSVDQDVGGVEIHRNPCLRNACAQPSTHAS